MPESGLSTADELRAQAHAGLKRRLAEHGRHAEEQVYLDRLDFEHLLLAHGQPLIGDGRAKLQEFVANETGA